MIVAADPDLHAGFMCSTFAAGTGEPGRRLREYMREGARAVVMVGNRDPLVFMGWAAVSRYDGGVIWAYVKPALRGQGVARMLLEALGCSLGEPQVALYRSPACDGMIRNGKPIVYAEEVRAA